VKTSPPLSLWKSTACANCWKRARASGKRCGCAAKVAGRSSRRRGFRRGVFMTTAAPRHRRQDGERVSPGNPAPEPRLYCCDAHATSEMGHSRRRQPEAVRPCTSATLPKADVNSTPWLPPLSAITGLMHCSKIHEQPRCHRDELAAIKLVELHPLPHRKWLTILVLK
jgi:hypothetical protein